MTNNKKGWEATVITSDNVIDSFNKGMAIGGVHKPASQQQVAEAMEKVIEEYGDTLKKMGNA